MRSRADTFLLFCFFLFCQIINCSAINIAEAVSIGSIQQWIQIKGTKSDAPILLFLHGGPGNSAMSYADKFTGELQKYFLVVQWGKIQTAALMKEPALATLAGYSIIIKKNTLLSLSGDMMVRIYFQKTTALDFSQGYC